MAASPPAADGFVARFVLSPGAAGTAAVLVGLLVFGAAMIKSRDERAAERARQWWTIFTWTFDRSTTSGAARLGPDLTQTLMERLYDRAKTDLEKEAVRAVNAGLLMGPKPPDEASMTSEGAGIA